MLGTRLAHSIEALIFTMKVIFAYLALQFLCSAGFYNEAKSSLFHGITNTYTTLFVSSHSNLNRPSL
jgi:hypothetical protein